MVGGGSAKLEPPYKLRVRQLGSAVQFVFLFVPHALPPSPSRFSIFRSKFFSLAFPILVRVDSPSAFFLLFFRFHSRTVWRLLEYLVPTQVDEWHEDACGCNRTFAWGIAVMRIQRSTHFAVPSSTVSVLLRPFPKLLPTISERWL